MLWFDDDGSRTVEEKVRRAARHYEDKHGSAPSLCFVHPFMLDESRIEAGGIEIRTANTVLPHHFWLGHAQTKRRRKSAA